MPVSFTPGVMKEHGCSISTIYQMKCDGFFTPGVMKEHGCSISTIYQMKCAVFLLLV